MFNHSFSRYSFVKILVLTCFLISLPAWPASSPKSIEGTTKVNAEEFIELVGEIPELIIIDARIPGDRKHGLIEGSLSLPDVETNCKSLAKVVATTGSPTLYYCNGIKCGRSAKAIKIAKNCGYKNIYWFRGGFEEWLAKGYPYIQE